MSRGQNRFGCGPSEALRWTMPRSSTGRSRPKNGTHQWMSWRTSSALIALKFEPIETALLVVAGRPTLEAVVVPALRLVVRIPRGWGLIGDRVRAVVPRALALVGEVAVPVAAVAHRLAVLPGRAKGVAICGISCSRFETASQRNFQ